ncbi:MAG: sulfite reductase, beta subunit [Microbacterium sp.]|jgi:Stress responsive A/B Barrel Domain|uniref:Dabb family protein n=1 Tax=Microbacterium ginsengisoli TaxID=400772 RepID=A0A0F0LX05_9MICO|nr:Dabb family protein [Microbacterium ginsengisoli]KJL39419.1 Stress responsive A/B Barrel Domain protein [Microbacterium ginsengisoli]MAL07782.1 sulfite reductase, beta subunit [Microbacterium sp.]MBN9207317.1 Dabb family protein [Microbacterium ginsengisoli]HAN24116.1 Dabb family protein [Microbacterium ginsengisoli]
MAYRHVVLFRVREGVSQQAIDEAIEALRALASLHPVRRWTVARSLDERKGVVIVEDATFDDASGFAEFRRANEHVSAAAQMSQISDWWVADFED